MKAVEALLLTKGALRKPATTETLLFQMRTEPARAPADHALAAVRHNASRTGCECGERRRRARVR